MGDVKELIDQKIAGKKVMVFSKTYCPYSIKTKKVFEKYLGDALSENDYEVMEIEALPTCGEIQDYLMNLTGDRTVPRVFINQKFIGGGEEIEDKDKSGELKTLLA